MLENHGVVAGGADLLTAFQRLETLDFCARIQILAQRLGGVVSLSDAQIALFDRLPQAQGTFTPGPASSRERELRLQLCDFVARACDRQLMISTEGVISARLDADRFVITPTGFDRRDLTPGDIVLIDGGRAEAGKRPSRSVNLHHAIYQRHADIGAIMTAQTPAATAYAVSTTHFDTRGIPESYVLLRDVPRVLYGQPYTAPERVAEVISTRAPVLLMQNDGVMTAGRTVLEAFDRLEVAEYSARALIDIEAIGALVPIGPKELEDLRTAYALD
jgi:L-fuculose-phosphate aldolase